MASFFSFFDLPFCVARKTAAANPITQPPLSRVQGHDTSSLSSETRFWEGEICLQ